MPGLPRPTDTAPGHRPSLTADRARSSRPTRQGRALSEAAADQPATAMPATKSGQGNQPGRPPSISDGAFAVKLTDDEQPAGDGARRVTGTDPRQAPQARP